MKTLTWQKPGQQNVAQELIKIIINYVAELRIKNIIRSIYFSLVQCFTPDNNCFKLFHNLSTQLI
ncbi:hypothetical protein DXA01_21550 [Bacteroides caccae]|nr:hypothetical protein DXA01_21550 [Bacteroides caccae]